MEPHCKVSYVFMYHMLIRRGNKTYLAHCQPGMAPARRWESGARRETKTYFAARRGMSD